MVVMLLEEEYKAHFHTNTHALFFPCLHSAKKNIRVRANQRQSRGRFSQNLGGGKYKTPAKCQVHLCNQ